MEIVYEYYYYKLVEKKLIDPDDNCMMGVQFNIKQLRVVLHIPSTDPVR